LSLLILSWGFFGLEFKHPDAVDRCLALLGKELNSKKVRFLSWIPGFSANSSSLSEILSGFIVRVQFPDLDPALASTARLTWLASLIGEV